GAYESSFLQRLVDTKTSRLGAEVVAGAQLDAGFGWALGAAVRSPRFVFHEDVETDNSTALISTGPAAPTVAVSAVDHAPIGAEGIGLTRPARFEAGAAKSFGPLELSAEAEVAPNDLGGQPQGRTVYNVRSGALWSAGPATLF